MKKRTILSTTLSIGIAITIMVAVYLFSQTQIFREFYVLSSLRSVGLQIDKWAYEGVTLSSDKYEFINPDIVKTEEGYKMYFGSHENIYVSASSDGLDWETVEKPIFTRAGGPVVRLPNKKFRMYIEFLDQGRVFKSAVSEDGINFEPEEGIRFAAGEDTFASIKNIGHPKIIWTGDKYLLYFDTGPYRNLKATAINDTCEVLYEGNEEAIPEIHYAYSKDGLNWTYGGKVIRFKQVSIPYFIGGWSPGVIKIGDEYRMYFHATRIRLITSNTGDVTNCEFESVLDPLWLATSKDGVNFDIVKQLTVFKSDPEVVQINGRLRLYVWDDSKIYSYVQGV